ncbi:thiamine-phosphate kinase [Chitinispirillales bacterium ANBcel5]|uniref:thiamine-phosphate kinase n=1 Tax=Cellulosispirillum alkaliphilum TaxID=3039283 RepID=UPI002A50E343|nr:thiamine-phosphate kinase [Chitinispirillales bacterium ANBcel5]
MFSFPSGEYNLLERLTPLCRAVESSSIYEKLMGDDAAVRGCSKGERLILTADVSVENVHFSLDSMSLQEIGYKAMVSNLSDCAAMGALPDGALVQLVFPKREQNLADSVQSIYEGFATAIKKWNFPIVGGDLSSGPLWTIAITLVGKVPEGHRVLKRTGIGEGDNLWVTGFPGKSAAGFDAIKRWGRDRIPDQFESLIRAHIAPEARITTAFALAAQKQVHAAMDLSDGLSKDIATLCYENKTGFLFSDITSFKNRAMHDLGNTLKCDWMDWFFGGGEEYELLFAADSAFDPLSCGIEQNDLEFIRLGSFNKQIDGVQYRDNNGKLKRIEGRSYDHIARCLKC